VFLTEKAVQSARGRSPEFAIRNARSL
jgi:hypothetical protein